MTREAPDDLEAWPPYSWDPLDRWLRWIEKTKLDATLAHGDRRMLLFNALAVLQGRLAETQMVETVVAEAEAELREARASGAADNFVPLLVDPPTPWSPMDEWLRFVASMRGGSPSSIQMYELGKACQTVLEKVALRRAIQLDPGLRSGLGCE